MRRQADPPALFNPSKGTETMPTATASAPAPTLPRTRPRGAKNGWDWNRGPARALHQVHGRVPAWVTHAYRYPTSRGQRLAHVAEPYELGPSAYEDFIFLKNSGYDVQVSAELACHCPGSTVAVVITARQ